jgi:hypothetical protein
VIRAHSRSIAQLGCQRRQTADRLLASDGCTRSQGLDALRAEHDNLRAALVFGCSSRDHSDAAFSIASRLAPFWRIEGDLTEGFGWLERALSAADPTSEYRPAALLGAVGTAREFLRDTWRSSRAQEIRRAWGTLTGCPG